jgi:hypothetical protein
VGRARLGLVGIAALRLEPGGVCRSASLAAAAQRACGDVRSAVPRVQRQLGHSNLGSTSIDLRGIDNGEIIDTVHSRHTPMIPVSASLRL